MTEDKNADSMHDLMVRATVDLHPNTADLVRRSIRRGSRLRRQRIAVTALAVAGTLGIAGVAAAALQGIGSHAGELAVASGSGTPSTGPTKGPSARPAKATADVKSHVRRRTPRQTLATLRAAVPDGLEVTQPDRWGTGDLTVARVTVDDGQGATELAADVRTGETRTPTCPTPDPRHCRVLADGSLLLTWERPVYTDKPDGVAFHDVELQRRDGVVVHLRSYNAPAEKGPSPTRTRPMFSLAQLTAMAHDERW